MTEYYSNKSDFSGQSTSVYSGTTGTGYYGATTSSSNPGTKVTNMLDDISTVTTKVQSEGVSHLYRQTGDAALGTEKSSSTFTNAVDRSQTLLAAAKRIHREIMQNIDSKFVKGLDEAYTSLNDVNGSETTYQTTNMTYGVTKTYQSGYSTAYGSQTKTITVQEHYTLAEILGADSPILAAQDIYTQRLAAIKEMLKTGDNLTAKQIKELKGKSDQELMETFYPTLQSDYEKIKGSSFQEDHKEVLQYLEIGLTVAAGLVAIVATAGTATPAIAAAATAANAYLLGSTAYSVATGETLITGTKLSTEERLWAAADLVATGLSAGSTKILGLAEAGKLSTKAADVVEGSSSLLKVTKHADDAMDAINIGKDVVTGDVQSLVMDAGMVGLSAVVKARNNTTVKTGGDSVNSDYQNYVARKKANGESYLSEADWTQKVSTLSANTATYSDFKASALESFKGTATDVESNITIETRNAAGDVQRVQVKAIGFDESGNVRIQDYTTAANGLSVNRQSLLDDLSKYGGTVVGEGKGAFTGGTEIKPGTQIDVVSQKRTNYFLDGSGNKIITLDNGERVYLSEDLYNGENIPVRSPEFLDDNGHIDWPKANGFILDSSGNPITSDANLTAGSTIDRYGESSGTFVSPVVNGESYPYESRGLPYPESYQQKHTYEVVKDINKTNYEEAFANLSFDEQQDLLGDMIDYHFTAEDIYNPQIGEISEVFGAGGGQQIKLGTSVSIYEKLGFLKEVK